MGKRLGSTWHRPEPPPPPLNTPLSENDLKNSEPTVSGG